MQVLAWVARLPRSPPLQVTCHTTVTVAAKHGSPVTECVDDCPADECSGVHTHAPAGGAPLPLYAAPGPAPHRTGNVPRTESRIHQVCETGSACAVTVTPPALALA